jgi:ABC-type multidrug transport system ATPase subunit
VVFLDEPTIGLDPAKREDMWDVVRRLVTDGSMVLLTTQYLEEADALADDSVLPAAASRLHASGIHVNDFSLHLPRETSVCTAFAASAGGSAPQTTSTRTDTDTDRPSFRASHGSQASAADRDGRAVIVAGHERPEDPYLHDVHYPR